MNFKQYLGKHICGNLFESEYPEFAVSGLLEGYESKYLGILAAMTKTDDTADLRKYFKWTIEDLNIELPKKRDASLMYSSGIVDEILNGQKDIIEGVDEIKNYAIDSYNFRDETDKYLFDSIGFERAYGLYVEYYDLLDEFISESNKTLIKETKAELFDEIKKWDIKLKNVV